MNAELSPVEWVNCDTGKNFPIACEIFAPYDAIRLVVPEN